MPGPRENPEQFDLCKYQNLHVSTHFSNTCLGTGLISRWIKRVVKAPDVIASLSFNRTLLV